MCNTDIGVLIGKLYTNSLVGERVVFVKRQPIQLKIICFAVGAESRPPEQQMYSDDSLVKPEIAANRVGMKGDKDYVPQVTWDYTYASVS